jgi:dTDP-4-dehydrorhamnose 3,5-epimerase-like enzyme
MSDSDAAFQHRWRGLGDSARARLALRDYASSALEDRVLDGRATAGDLIDGKLGAEHWIPGVEVFHRRIFAQRHRGHFGEFAREGQGIAGKIGMWPKQWATALMQAGTSKGFHIHPPSIPGGVEPAAWFRRLFIDEPQNHSLRPYDEEQWDMMFFITGQAEMFLIDERAGMPRRRLRFFIEGDDTPGPNNAGVVIPAGVAHAIRAVGSKDLIMVYGTSTTFDPENEGRIAHGVETPTLPEDWQSYWETA